MKLFQKMDITIELKHSIEKFIKQFGIIIPANGLKSFLNNEIEVRSLLRISDDSLELVKEFLIFRDRVKLLHTCKYLFSQMDALRSTIIKYNYPNNVIEDAREQWKNYCIDWLYNDILRGTGSYLVCTFNKIKDAEKQIKYCESELKEYKSVKNPSARIRNAITTYTNQLKYEKNRLESIITDDMSSRDYELIECVIWTSQSKYIIDIPKVDMRLYGEIKNEFF